jgi:hypothetical protein
VPLLRPALLSEEYPARLASAFNDAFVAEMDATTWTSTGSIISAPGNFAALPDGQPLTIKATRLRRRCRLPRRRARRTEPPPRCSTRHITVSAGATHTLYLSLFDQGDSAVDSAVFIDDLTLSTPAVDCAASLSPVGPRRRPITGPTIAATGGHAHADADRHGGRARGGHGQDLPGPRRGGHAGANTLAAVRSGDTWSRARGACWPRVSTPRRPRRAGAPGIDGVSAPTTFTVSAPAAPTQPGTGSSRQQAPGGSRRRRDPG